MGLSPSNITPQQSFISPSFLSLSPRGRETEQRAKVTTEVASTTLRAEQRSGSPSFSLTQSPTSSPSQSTSNYVPPSFLSLDSSSISASSSSSTANGSLAHESSQNPTQSTETSTSSEKSLKYVYVAVKNAYVVDCAGGLKIIDVSDSTLPILKEEETPSRVPNLISSSPISFTPVTVTANTDNRSSVSSSLSASSSLSSESSSSSLSSTDSSSLEGEGHSNRQEMCSILNKVFHTNLKV